MLQSKPAVLTRGDDDIFDYAQLSNKRANTATRRYAPLWARVCLDRKPEPLSGQFAMRRGGRANHSAKVRAHLPQINRREGVAVVRPGHNPGIMLDSETAPVTGLGRAHTR